MKKNRFMTLMAAGLAIIAGGTLSSCSNNDEDSASGRLAIMSVLPTKVIPGQEVTITGTALDGVTEVVFPGDKKVSEIKKVGTGLISVKTPAGLPEEGGQISVVNSNGDVVTFHDLLTIGHPAVKTVAPLDKEVLINEKIEVYGSDLEFISQAIFPAKNGGEVTVDAKEFKRKSTSVVIIPVPMGIQGGEAAIKLVDCAGTVYPIKGITLSEKVSGATDPTVELVPLTVWNAGFDVTAWNWCEPNPGDFNWQGFELTPGMTMKFIITGAADGARFCYCRGNWAGIDLGGENDPNNIGIPAGDSQVSITLTEELIDDFKNSSPVFHVSGENYHLEQIVIMVEPSPTVWKGEALVNEWLTINPGDLNLSMVTPEAGDTLRFVFADHDAAADFYSYTAWWAPIDFGNGGAAPVTIEGGQTTFDWTLTEEVANAMKDVNSGTAAFIIGGNGTMTLLEIQVLK